MEIGLAGENAVLAGAAVFLILCIAYTQARKRAQRRRRAKPAYPTAPHTTTMWATQPVSAPATRAGQMTDQALAMSPDEVPQLVGPINPNATIL
jgi:hypothetical protein